jgi:hypothetical protein
MSQAASAQGGPTRRSVRLSSVARSVGSQSVVTATPGASITPSRRRGPLAKVKARQSTAYGASGRLGEAEELTVPVTGFVQAFQSQRVAAVSRADEPLMSGAFNGAAAQNSPTPDRDAATPSPSAYESEDPPSDEDEDDSGANTSKSFGMLREAGMLRPPPSLGHPRSGDATKAPTFKPVLPQLQGVTRARAPQAAAAPPVAVAPRRLSLRRRSVDDDFDDFKPGWKKYLLLGLLPILVAMGFYMLSGGPAVKIQLASGLNHIADWISPPSSDADQAHLRGLLNKQALSLKDVQAALYSLRKELPAEFAATPNQDGSWAMNDGFWKALISKLQTDGPSPDWEEFLRKNEANVQKMYEEGLSWQQNQGTVILRDELFAAMNSSWSNMSSDVDKKVAELTQSLVKEASKVAAKEAKKVTIEEGRLHSLALTGLLTNIELRLRKVNYFSPGLGAKVISSITSATFVDNPAVLARLGRRLMFSPERRPPAAALDGWEEPGDCWCSAPDDTKKGKAQLGVQLTTPIFPTQFTVEHVPMAMVPQENVSNAPRQLEVWVRSDEPAIPRFGLDNTRCEAGPPGWICLGKAHYDIRGANHIQTFLLDAESQTAVDQVMVRVTNNWGADHTCIYRVRLHGKDSLPSHEYRLHD